MRRLPALVLGLLPCLGVHAQVAEKALTSTGAVFLQQAQRQAPQVLNQEPSPANKAQTQNATARGSTLAQALTRAWKKGMIEEGIEASRQMLLECQKETSVVLTTPFMRPDSQQAHCFRF